VLLSAWTEEGQEPHGYRRLSFQRTRQQQSSAGDSACHRSAELMQRLRYFSVMFLPKMKPNSSTARNWFASVPVLPKTPPACSSLRAPTRDRCERTCLLLVGRRRGESGACAASPKDQQVDRSIGCTSRTGKVFHASRKREAALEGVADVQCAASCRCTLSHAYLRVGRQLAVLEVRRNAPWALSVCIDHRVHIAVVLHRCCRRLIGGLSRFPIPSYTRL